MGEDLEAAVSRLRPMMSIVAGAAQESDHMLFQMKKGEGLGLEFGLGFSMLIPMTQTWLLHLRTRGGALRWGDCTSS